MTEQLISFETAKIAKEKGFREFNGVYYQDNSKVTDSILARPNSYDNSDFRFIKCSQSLLQKWLREEHKVNVFCLPDNYDTDIWFSVIGGYGDPKVKNDGHHRTYEEALEVGLQEALKLIRNERFT